MKGYVFDPSRLVRPPKQLERDGYAMAARMLRDYLGGGDIFAEVREGVRRDPRIRAMFRAARRMLAPVGGQTPRRGRRRTRRPRRLR